MEQLIHQFNCLLEKCEPEMKHLNNMQKNNILEVRKGKEVKPFKTWPLPRPKMSFTKSLHFYQDQES